MGLSGTAQMERAQKIESQSGLQLLLLEEQVDLSLQEKLEFLDAQADALLDQQVQQQQRLEDSSWSAEEEGDSADDLFDLGWSDEEADPCQLRQLQLQTELQLQQVQLEELDMTLEAVLAATEDYAPRRAGESLLRAGHRVQSQLALLAVQLRALLPCVQEMEQGATPGQPVQHLHDRLGAVVCEVSESLYALEVLRGDSGPELRQLERQFLEQELKLRALHHRVGQLIAESGRARAGAPGAPASKPHAPRAWEQRLVEKDQHSKDFMSLCMPGTINARHLALAAIAA